MIEMTEHLEAFPFPVVVLDEKEEIFYRNRLAKRLLPPPYRLKKQMKRDSFPQKRGFSQVCLDDISYFTAVFSFMGRDCVFFLENFLPFYESLSRVVLEEANSSFWNLLPFGEEEKHLSASFLDGFAARTYRLRQAEKDYLRLLQLRSRSFENIASCSLQGFFRHLSGLLLKRGIKLESRCPAEAAVRIDPSELTFIILNLVHFVFLFEGEDRISVFADKKKDGYRIFLKFADREGFLSAMKALLLGEEPLPCAMNCIPFLCMASVCNKERFHWSVREDKGEVEISFVLPASDFLPDAFLSDTAAKEVQDLIRAEKEYFS